MVTIVQTDMPNQCPIGGQQVPLEVRGLSPLLSVFDMRKAIRFYRDQLGFSLAGTSPALSEDPDHVNWAMLQLNDATVMLNTAFDPEDQPLMPESGRWSGHQDTCIYFGCPDVEGAYDFLRAQGLEVSPPKVAPYGMKQLYLTDPDGYLLCFQWRA
jgi:uncharacterized glyoxalase superfamily protein PhnB